MTRILHTADLHLSENRPERWRALEAVVDLAVARDVEGVLVAGDLLDRGENHAALRPRIRKALEKIPAPVFLLPGNHDREAYGPEQDWGVDTQVLLDEPVDAVETGGLRILAVPFPSAPTSFGRFRRHVEDRIRPPNPHILALHGTLIDARAPQIHDDSQEEEPGPYFPIRTRNLRDLDLGYVALGHYHQYDLRHEDGVPIAYAGAPSPIGAYALGPRSAVVAELRGGEFSVEPVRLPVAYRRRVTRWLTPFRESETLEELARELETLADPDCDLRVTLRGIIAGISEAELREKTGGVESRFEALFGELEVGRESVALESHRAELFREFRERLSRRAREREAASEPLAEPVRQRALELAARVLSA